MAHVAVIAQGPLKVIGGGRRGNSRQVAKEELGNRRQPSQPASAPRVTEPGACQGRVTAEGTGSAAAWQKKKQQGTALERSGTHGPAGMALTAASALRHTALPSPQWPPLTPGRPCQASRHCAGAPEDQQVGGTTRRKCPFLPTSLEIQLAGTAWRSCLQAEPQVARQPVRAQLTSSRFSGETLGYQ